jgi:choline-glycine betaine transporter
MGLKEGTISEFQIGPFVLNPVVSFVGFCALWGLAIYCMVCGDPPSDWTDDDEYPSCTVDNTALDRLVKWRNWVSNVFTWFYIGSQDAWIAFAIFLWWKYGHIKLCARGEEDKKPEFSDAAYFMMTFSAGVAVGLFFYGAAEPIWLYYGDNRYNNAASGGLSDFENAQWAMTQTIYHWGIHGWIPYQVVGASMAVASYRQGLPMTIRSCFYPILGNGIYGWVGDAIDALSIVTIVGGVCTSLGLGTQSIASGIHRLSPDLWDDTDDQQIKDTNTLIIILITLVATLSVVSGLNYGIKTLSLLAFNAGMVLLLTVFFMDNTWFFLNLMVQTLGHYLQNFMFLSFYTDAWSEVAITGNGSEGSPLSAPADGFHGSIMASWTIFYWGWWISWAPFVGVFLARISKGRTISELITYSLIAPLLYCIIWFGVFGGAAIKSEWTYQNASAANALVGAGEDLPYPVVTDEETGIECLRVSTGGIELACSLYDSPSADVMFFMLLKSYDPYGDFLTGLSVFCLIVYFITSSDSGSLVVDTLAANGKDCHWLQRVLWAFTEGAVAIGLMQAGGSSSTTALQAISVVFGLPYTVVLCFMCVSLAVACEQEDQMNKRGLLTGELMRPRRGFKLELHRGVFDILEFLCSFNAEYLTSFVAALPAYVLNCVLPVLTLAKVNQKIGPDGAMTKADMFFTLLATVSWILFWCLRLSTLEDNGYATFSWVAYLAFVMCVTMARGNVRNLYFIEANMVEDFFATLFLFPNVLSQIGAEVDEPRPKKDDALPAVSEGQVEIELSAAKDNMTL